LLLRGIGVRDPHPTLLETALPAGEWLVSGGGKLCQLKAVLGEPSPATSNIWTELCSSPSHLGTGRVPSPGVTSPGVPGAEAKLKWDARSLTKRSGSVLPLCFVPPR